jgi:hypothetical protein
MDQAFCLFSAGQARKGIEPAGPTYAEREILAAIRAHAKPARSRRKKT